MKIKIKVNRRTSAEIVASIDDLLTEILLRLPMKSLIRFKSVSKNWHSLITNPQFCILRNPSPNPPIGLFLQQSNVRISPTFEYVSFSISKPTINPPLRKLSFTKDPTGIGIVQSCNGLLLCSSFRPRSYIPRYYVFNPTTRRFSKLPKLPGLEEGIGRSDMIHGMSLAFDPAKSPHYKALCVRGWQSNSMDYMYQLLIYSSEKGPWRKSGEPFTAGSANFDNGVYWNGAIHWISNEGGDSLYFNLDEDDDYDEMPRIMPLPPIPDGWDWRSNYYFGESCDHLHYIELLMVGMQLDVYEMKRDYSEWFVKYKVDLAPVLASYPVMNRDNYDMMYWHSHGFSIFSLVRGDKEEDSFLVIQIPGRVVRYNFVGGSFETIHEYEGAEVEVTEGSLRYLRTNGFQYIESLCCV